MGLLPRSSGMLRRYLGVHLNSSLWRSFAVSALNSAPEGADAYANAFDLGDTGSVPKEEYADTFPDKYIMKVFKHQQESYRRYLDGIKDVKIPPNPDSQEFATFAEEMEKLKAKSGLPTVLELSGAQMVTMAVDANNSFRRFLELVTENADMQKAKGNWDLIFKALDDVETSHGPVPLTGDSKAAAAFSQRMEEVASKIQKEVGPSFMNEVIDAYRLRFQQFRDGQGATEADGMDDLEEGANYEDGDDLEGIDDLNDGEAVEMGDNEENLEDLDNPKDDPLEKPTKP